MSDFYSLAVGLMCASAAESIFERELRITTERDVMRNHTPSIPPVPGAVAPVLVPGSDYGSKVAP